MMKTVLVVAAAAALLWIPQTADQSQQNFRQCLLT
jgi:hypothetical protein